MISRVKGTQDFLDLTFYNFIIDSTRKHLSKARFTEIATPILEHTELFKRSLGLHTEVVSKEMYTVVTGHEEGDESGICLRPEGTASVMRAFFNNHITERPWKVFSHGPMFRHERPQKGRFRQFHQTTIEILAASSIAHDAELIALLNSLFVDTFQLSDYTLLINFLGSNEDRANYKQALRAYLDEQSFLPEKIHDLKEKNILRIFDLKDDACKQAVKDAPILTDYLSTASQQEWEQLKALLTSLSIPFIQDPRLVRGLDYYNKTVFEFVSNHLGAQNTFCGGGRYDCLSQVLGEKEIVPSLGAAFGMERIAMLLEDKKNNLALPITQPLQMILPMTDAQQPQALEIAQLLRHNNITCEVSLDTPALKNMLRKADKAGAQHVLILGENEIQEKSVTIKNMVTGNEKKIKIEQLINYFTAQ